MKFLRKLYGKLRCPKYIWTYDVPTVEGWYWYRSTKGARRGLKYISNELCRHLKSNGTNQWSQRISEPEE